jgi:hypothetical protein
MASRQRLVTDMSYRLISRASPLMPMSIQPKFTGASYAQRWREISANWVSLHGNPQTVAVCLETIWNSPASTTEGYRTVGMCLAEALADFIAQEPKRSKP